MSEQRLRAEIDAIKQGLEGILAKLSEIEKAYQQLPTQAKAEMALSKELLNKLPFKPYKEGSKAGWIFADISEAKQLYDLIKESKTGKVPLHGFEYSISKGETREFIGRRPID